MAKPKPKLRKSQTNNTKPSTPPKPPPPTWPPFKPPLPVIPLSPTPHPSFPDKIVLLPNFFPRSLCRSYVSFLRTLPLTTTPGRPRKGEAVRVNDRFQVDDPAFAERLWAETGLRDVLAQEEFAHLWGGQVMGLNPNIRVYRYSKSQFFDCHYDDSNPVALPPNNTPCKTTWTLLLYLTSASDPDGCIGGETVFYPHDRQLEKEAVVVAPETGLVLLHKHGNDCLLVSSYYLSRDG
ncbi:hypothetical protein SAPIO_CDS7472 [Scedosporium apiospermum]|uniref:Prolyl 4-hydroxylase alpha subunit Fe(2+) 2OG dioxygenase domain-containing protein n=1 Tax=Pseudallescheria apiosperma TaxID=563466 RepID=A0A084G1Z6_PSEDA|nr:uncharacterized protein SAPIO_CDS7472 [Scedosporium apiospermum]KEZ41358.1 hypothetical protein SAPIO_CDS7472 [Scedosporium apiospermum]